ncbi:metal-dependent hydrolase [Halodesulfurarchaeum sp. HSR-GB]|uniref:metal-dependent hydrolase n=1 Tax=Halodesulfurarchaeum sp. HSR-GB TaxID=3074077 RepID=UPI0028622178|nr:metal-dependent hydrolase [Halodesulfurarchaeum sp. HSR-GB]MDR5656015.1 metal-dependent hydrolase [Halodesulfurarchaeum sp. HSR-GB]
MATTHALVGIAIAAAAAVAVPEITLLGIVAAAAGGVFPDLDLYAGHRRTLHYPVYFSIAAVPAVLLAVLLATPAAWAVALFLLAAAAHSIMDAAGGGLELRPWRGRSQRAVYSHFHGRWLRPRRYVRYDGAPEDLALGAIVAAPVLITVEGPVALGIWALLLVSVVYTLVRKPMVAVAEWLFERVPSTVRTRLPDRFLEETVNGDTKS